MKTQAERYRYDDLCYMMDAARRRGDLKSENRIFKQIEEMDRVEMERETKRVKAEAEIEERKK